MTESRRVTIQQAISSLNELCSSEISKQTKNDVTFLEKCKQRCSSILKKGDLCNNDQGLNNVFQEYAQAMFDFTYHDENQLVNEEFPEHCSKDTIQKIFDNLDQIVHLTESCNPDSKMIDVLGSEITECYHWRKGALLYMYCSTVQENTERMKRLGFMHIQNLHGGIRSLEKMLLVRGENKEDLKCDTAGNNDTLHLIKNGIYSDTHLLSMMYAGEMCYWYCMNDISRETNLSELESVKKIGIKLLNNYIEAVKGPLAGQGWSFDRAEMLLKELST